MHCFLFCCSLCLVLCCGLLYCFVLLCSDFAFPPIWPVSFRNFFRWACVFVCLFACFVAILAGVLVMVLVCLLAWLLVSCVCMLVYSPTSLSALCFGCLVACLLLLACFSICLNSYLSTSHTHCFSTWPCHCRGQRPLAGQVIHRPRRPPRPVIDRLSLALRTGRNRQPVQFPAR